MSAMTESYLFLQALAAHRDHLYALLGEEWPAFQEKLDALLQRIDRSKNKRKLIFLVDEIIALGLDSPAAELVRSLLQQVQEEAGTVNNTTRSMHVADPASGETRQVTIEDAPDAGQKAVLQAALALKEAVSPLEKAVIDPSSPRYLNTLFTRPGGETIPPQHPLIPDQAYYLYVEISPEQRGLGEAEATFPEQMLEEVWKGEETLPLTVWVASHDFEVQQPQLQTLALPLQGSTVGLRFTIIPRRRERWGLLLVQVYYRGHLLQTRQVEAYIVSGAGASAPASIRPLQSARTTFTATEQLDPDNLAELPERLLTINVQRDQRDGSLNLLFLERTTGDRSLAAFDTHLRPEALQTAIDAVREELMKMAGGRQEADEAVAGYQYILEGEEALLNEWLPRLALVGHRLYRQLLGSGTKEDVATARAEQLRAALRPGTVIQVNPVVGRVTLPWALLYERPVKFIPGKTRVCEGFAECGPDCAACPSKKDPYTICPYAFWGYRYAIEQIPCWVQEEMPQLPTLIRAVDNGRPLHLNLNVWRDFSFWQAHRRKLARAGEIEILLAEEVAEMEQVWGENGAELDIVYFYTHGGRDALLGPYLRLSDASVNSEFLEASSLSWPRAPLVFLNGCGTGAYGPESYVSLIDDFRAAGASGVIGTECAVPELFAEAYAAALFPRFFRGEQLGQAMLAVRLDFLRRKQNPLGLLYTPYAAHEVALARPVAEPADDTN